MNYDVSSSQNSTAITTAPIEIPESEPLDDDVQIINNKDNCVTLDDDSDVIIEENTPFVVDIDSDDLEIIESKNTPIVIEDEERNCVINPLNVMKKKQDQLFDTVCTENSSLAQLIEEAINLDASGSMKRIIQRTLIPLYLSCRTSFKESEFFKNTLKRTTNLLETAPHLKYSHVKSLCEILKNSRKKLKVPRRQQTKQIQQTKETLQTKQTSESSPKKRRRKHKKVRWCRKRKKNSTNVDLTKPKRTRDNTESIDPKGSNTSNTMIEIEIPSITTSISPTSDKENIVTDNIQTRNDRLYKNSNNKTDTTHITISNNTEIEPNNLLTPHYAINTQIPSETTQQKVESLEKQIAYLKKDLEKVEEQEVTVDNTLSPYIIAETIKAKIVKLYQELCDLMDAEPTKRHEVKLQVVNGHPPGPARCLEEYINDNIDEYGNPPFPDIFDVVRCVEKAVYEDRLLWNKKQIVAEAQVLLKHYGHAIQKRRKKREWRDMVSLCKEELVDPADLDPVLEAKLLENSRIAKKNEDEIVNRYARLEKENSSNPAFRLSLETADDSESDNDDSRGPSHNNMLVDNNIPEAPTLIMPDSTTNLENIQVNTNIINPSNIQSTSNARKYLEINPQGCSSIINPINVVNGSNVINAKNIVEPNTRNASSLINSKENLTTNIQNWPIFLINTPDNLIPNIHGRICFINSTPVFATRIQGCPNLTNPTNNLEGNLQNSPNNVEGAPNFINSNNFAGNLQSGYNFMNSSNNVERNVQNCPSIINTSNHLEGNLQNELNNLEGNLQSGYIFMNSSNNLEGNIQNRPSNINTSNNLAGNLENGLNNLEGNLQNGPNNLEGNQHSCPVDSTTDKIQSTVTNIGNVEYNRTIMMDSNGSDTDNERREAIDIVTDTNIVKERDKSDIDEIEYKIKIKQEEDDVIKLLSELDSDCVATIFDIEDPFLVIEISDSSDDEE